MTRQHGEFDETTIGASLVLSFGDQIVQTSATVNAHRIARSNFAQNAFPSYVEFYLYSPDGSKPSLATVAGVPPVSLGLVTSTAALNKYCGEDTHGFGFAPDGKWYNNGSGTSLAVTFTYGDYIGVSVDPTNNTVQFYKNGAAIGSAVTITSSSKLVLRCNCQWRCWSHRSVGQFWPDAAALLGHSVVATDHIESSAVPGNRSVYLRAR
jgi:hypothetical protein